MYLFVTSDKQIVGFAYNNRMAVVDGVFYVGNERDANPHPGSSPVVIPEQKIGWMFDDGGNRLEELMYPDDVPILPDDVMMREQVDYESGLSISSRTHSSAPLEEQIGIIRCQLVQVINALGVEATKDFARLNDVAIAEIEKARIEKEALDA